MDIKQLINFITIVEEGNITKAAKKLHMSQPPLSNQLRLLEEELGVKLIDRGSRKITLTDVGHLLYRRSKNMVKLFESTLNEVEDFKSGVEGVLKIGVVSTCGEFLPNNIITPYMMRYPKMRYELYEANTYEVIDMIEKGIVDIGIVRSPFNTENLCCMKLKTEEMVAVVNSESGDKFSLGDREFINLEDLKDKPITIYRRYEKLIMEAFKENDIIPRIYCLCEDSRTAVAWAKFALSISLVPKSTIQHNSSKKIRTYKINEKSLETDIVVIWNEDKYISKGARHLLEMVKDMEF